MASPDGSNELLIAIRDELLSVPELVALVDGRIYDRPMQEVTFPYVQLGETQVLPFNAICVRGTSIYVTLHTWAREGWAGDIVRQMSALIVPALDLNKTLDLGPDHVCQLIEYQDTRVFRDPDGTTRHGVIEFRADITIDA